MRCNKFQKMQDWDMMMQSATNVTNKLVKKLSMDAKLIKKFIIKIVVVSMRKKLTKLKLHGKQLVNIVQKVMR